MISKPKKILASLLTFVLFIAMVAIPVSVLADDRIDLYLNGNKLSPQVEPRLIGSIAFVPLRIVAEELGAQIFWEQKDSKITIQYGSKQMIMSIGQGDVTVNGLVDKLPAVPIIKDGHTLIPLRFIGEQFGMIVTWDEFARAVYIFERVEPPAEKGIETSIIKNSNDSSIVKPAPVPAVIGSSALPIASVESSLQINNLPPASSNNLASISAIATDNGEVRIQADKPVKAKSFILTNPNRLVIDVYDSKLGLQMNGQLSLQNGEVLSKHPMISKIIYSQFSSSPSIVRFVLHTTEYPEYFLEAKPEQFAISVSLSSASQSVEKAIPKFKVVIDAGHGGKDPGTNSINKLHEKEFTLNLSNKIYELMKKERMIEPFKTRTSDIFILPADRIEMANEMKADLFISIHGNAYKSSTIRGTETYYTNPDSLQAAKIMHSHIVKAAGFPDRGYNKRGYKVTREADMPSVLLEIGYMTNTIDNKEMQKNAFQDKLAAAIVNAAKEILAK